ncbi:MAG: hypothetical protein GC158_13710 [Cyanobacteria bacterium RI_101]|nr:hypothetical protein [Cyanobacteria bacterium RI_101]
MRRRHISSIQVWLGSVDSSVPHTLQVFENYWEQLGIDSCYDFGDQWTCEVIFEKVLEPSSRRKYPTCIAGKNAGPPEDCGGPEAYMYARGALKRAKGKKRRDRLPAHERQFYSENYPDFDPDKFDRAAVNRELRELEEEVDINHLS